MPLYEYQCRECDKHFERIEKASSPTDGVCPVCGGSAHRLLGAPALKFKGSGWYVNDYGKGNGSRPSPTEKTTDATSSPPVKSEKSASSDATAATSGAKVA